MLSNPVPTDYHTLADIRGALKAGKISGGMVIEMSMQHPELQDAAATSRFVSYVSAYGVRVERSQRLAPTDVTLSRPA